MFKDIIKYAFEYIFVTFYLCESIFLIKYITKILLGIIGEFTAKCANIFRVTFFLFSYFYRGAIYTAFCCILAQSTVAKLADINVSPYFIVVIIIIYSFFDMPVVRLELISSTFWAINTIARSFFVAYFAAVPAATVFPPLFPAYMLQEMVDSSFSDTFFLVFFLIPLVIYDMYKQSQSIFRNIAYNEYYLEFNDFDFQW